MEDIHTEIFAEGIRDKIFDTETIAALGHALVGHEDNDVRSVVKFFTAAIAQGALHCFHRIFILKYLQRAFRDKIFDTETIATLGRALGDEDSTSISEAVWSSSSLLPWLKVRSVFSWDIHTEIFAEGFWDKIFDTETVAALGRALGDEIRHQKQCS
jgi:hypothetical protein